MGGDLTHELSLRVLLLELEPLCAHTGQGIDFGGFITDEVFFFCLNKLDAQDVFRTPGIVDAFQLGEVAFGVDRDLELATPDGADTPLVEGRGFNARNCHDKLEDSP